MVGIKKPHSDPLRRCSPAWLESSAGMKHTLQMGWHGSLGLKNEKYRSCSLQSKKIFFLLRLQLESWGIGILTL
jgi:hypothetical protein